MDTSPYTYISSLLKMLTDAGAMNFFAPVPEREIV
jgi:hypothetical protein